MWEKCLQKNWIETEIREFFVHKWIFPFFNLKASERGWKKGMKNVKNMNFHALRTTISCQSQMVERMISLPKIENIDKFRRGGVEVENERRNFRSFKLWTRWHWRLFLINELEEWTREFISCKKHEIGKFNLIELFFGKF